MHNYYPGRDNRTRQTTEKYVNKLSIVVVIVSFE